jgi:hypothetical protein
VRIKRGVSLAQMSQLYSETEGLSIVHILYNMYVQTMSVTPCAMPGSQESWRSNTSSYSLS